MGEQVDLALSKIRSDNGKLTVCQVVIDQLSEFIILQHVWLDTKLGISSPAPANSRQSMTFGSTSNNSNNINTSNLTGSGINNLLVQLLNKDFNGKINQASVNIPLERVCSYVNNMARFIE